MNKIKDDKIKLMIPKKSEYIATARITISSIGNLLGFNIEDIDDLKVIISEICIFFINHIKDNENPLEIEYFIKDKKIIVEVKDLNKHQYVEDTMSLDKSYNEMSILIIESLSDKYKIDMENKKINFEKYINSIDRC